MSAPACSYCGIAAEQGAGRSQASSARMELDTVVCGGCAALDPDRPGSALRAAARLLGVLEVDRHLAEALYEEAGALDGVMYADPGDPLVGRSRAPQREPWKHVGPGTWAALERARVRADELRESAGRPRPETPPPSGPSGCLLCGVGASASWRRVLTASLTPGPDHVEGHFCADCSEEHDRVGAVGPSLIESAARTHAGLPPEGEVRQRALKAWVATGLPPGEPWSWVDLRPPEPDPDPVDEARAQLADLAARVAELERRLL